MNEENITKSFEDTQNLGGELAQLLHAGDVILLYGDLGAGKTTFMQGLSKGLGIHHRIISPTFIIVRKYDVPPNTNEKRDIKRLYHIDLYRTETEDDLKGIGLTEVVEDKDAVVAIEWPEKMGNVLPEKRWDVSFQWITEEERKITIKKYE